MNARLTRTTRRSRLFATSALALTAALSLTACDSGEGSRDAGAAQPAAPVSSPSQPAASDTTDTTDSKPSTGTSQPDRTAPTGAQQTSARTDKNKGNTGTSTAPTPRVRCDAANVKVTAQVVKRPLNTMILTATNKGSKLCDLFYAPVVRFEGAQSVPPAMEDTKPQAVVSLKPGESGYAAVKLSSPTGTPDPGYTAKTLSLGFYDAAHRNVKGFTDVRLPAKGVYIDSSLTVSYWQSDLNDVSDL